jgi:hypothetical protein
MADVAMDPVHTFGIMPRQLRIFFPGWNDHFEKPSLLTIKTKLVIRISDLPCRYATMTMDFMQQQMVNWVEL